MTITRWITCFLFVALFAAGCGPKPATPEPPAETVVIPTPPPPSGLPLPKGFPGDVHPDTRSEVVLSSGEDGQYTIRLRSANDMATQSAYYKKVFSDTGWTEDRAVDVGGRVVLMFKKGNRNANLALYKEDGATHVAITLFEAPGK